MRVSCSRKPLQHFYSLGSEILQEVSDAKYLGIQIDNKLDWNKHISTVAARGQSKLAFLNRNLKGCPKKLRDTAYISLIRPALEYSCSVWHPHKKSNKDKIEKVQRRVDGQKVGHFLITIQKSFKLIINQLLLLLLFASIGAFVQSRFLGSKKLNSLIDSTGLSHKFTVDKALG